MPITKKTVVKRENYVEENLSNKIFTDDGLIDLSIPLDDDEDLDLIRKHKTENNNTTLKKDEDIDLNLSLDEDEDLDIVRQHQTEDNNTTLKNNTDNNSALSSDEDKKTNNINTNQPENNNIAPKIDAEFKKKKDYKTPEEYIAKINTPEFTFCGYKITSLAEGEVYILEKLGLNEDIMSNYCLAKNVFLDYMQGYDEDFKFKKQWGFPYSGNYIGYILNCKPSDFRNGEYYVEFLANDFDVCLFRFTTSFRDTVNNCIKRQLGWTNNIFKQSDYTALKGFLVCISVENVYLENKKTFSNITNFKIIADDTAKLLDKLVNDMSR